MALDALGWTDHSQFILEGFMKLTQPSDLLLTATRSRGRALKWQNIWAALIVLNQQVCRSASILGGNRILLYCPPPPNIFICISAINSSNGFVWPMSGQAVNSDFDVSADRKRRRHWFIANGVRSEIQRPRSCRGFRQGYQKPSARSFSLPGKSLSAC